MAIERTLSIIKPDGIVGGVSGKIISMYEEEGYKIIGQKKICLKRKEAEEFYGEHKGKGFYESLVEYMISGPILVQVLEGEDIILRHRDLMGATDPKKAVGGTIRNLYGKDIERNVVHGSDSELASKFEVGFFFNRGEIVL